MKNKIKKKLELSKLENKNKQKDINHIKDNENKNNDRDIQDNKFFENFDEFPNENLFQKVDYNINEKLEFQNENDRINYLLFLFNTSKYNSIVILSLLYLRFYLFKIQNIFKGKSEFLISLLFSIISFIISFFLLTKKNINDKSFKNIWITKLIFDINQSIYIYISIINNPSQVLVIDEFIYNSISIIILNFRIKDIIYPIVVLLSTLFFAYYKSSYLPNFFNIFYGLIICVITVYLFKKSLKYLWVLYDSFNKSFEVFNKFMENSFSPIFIISKNMEILYYNDAAKEFNDYILKELKSNKEEKNKLKMVTNFQKLIIPSLYPLFSQLLEYSINNKKESNFYFPFTNLENELNLEYKSELIYFLISGDFQKLIWFNVICNNCIWKINHCIFLSLIPCKDFLYNDSLNNQIKILLDKYENYIENSNKMCEIILKCEQNSIIKNRKNSYKTIGIYMKQNDKSDTILSFNNIKSIFPNMDFSFLFFFKDQSEVLCDLLLTQNLYFSFLNMRFEFNEFLKKEVNLEFFTNYFLCYFDVLLTSKNISLEFNIKENCKNIIIEESLLRITVFNVLLFIISNTKLTNNKKGIVCSIRLAKEKNYQNKSYNYSKNSISDFFNIKKNSYNNEKVNKEFKNNGIFSLQFDFSVCGGYLLDYNKINTILQYQNDNESFLITEMEKQNLNIGLLTAYYIITKYYKKEFIMNSNEKGNIILFKLICEKSPKSNNDDFYDEDTFCYFNESFYFYNRYYHEKIIKKFYNVGLLPIYNQKLNYKYEINLNLNSLKKYNDFDSEKDLNKPTTKIIKKNDFISKNKNINKIKTELKLIENHHLSKNNQFDSFKSIDYNTE